MKEIIITREQAGIRLDRFLARQLPSAPMSFFYRMLRAKNITVNRKKAEANHKLAENDSVFFFLSDETMEKFGYRETGSHAAGKQQAVPPLAKEQILYEDADLLFINKHAGQLSQKAKAGDVSLVEELIAYLRAEGKVDNASLSVCKPSVCNRLDRNTSGLLTAGLSIQGLQFLSEGFRDRSFHKYYYALVSGRVEEEMDLHGYLYPSIWEKTSIVKEHLEDYPWGLRNFVYHIETAYRPLAVSDRATLLEVLLITGKTHQIRAHLSAIGHPIIGDVKYGGEAAAKRQMLHAARLEFPEITGHFAYLSGKRFTSPLPADFQRTLEAFSLPLPERNL